MTTITKTSAFLGIAMSMITNTVAAEEGWHLITPDDLPTFEQYQLDSKSVVEEALAKLKCAAAEDAKELEQRITQEKRVMKEAGVGDLGKMYSLAEEKVALQDKTKKLNDFVKANKELKLPVCKKLNSLKVDAVELCAIYFAFYELKAFNIEIGPDQSYRCDPDLDILSDRNR